MKKVILLCCILCSLYIHAQEQLRWKHVEVPQYEIVDRIRRRTHGANQYGRMDAGRIHPLYPCR